MLKKSHCSQNFITLDCRKKSDKPKVWNVQYLTNFYPMEATLLPLSVKCEPIALQQHVYWVFGLKLIDGWAFSMHVV
jgi:hypothetical protein